MKIHILFTFLFGCATILTAQVSGGRAIYQVLDFSPSARITALGGSLITIADHDLPLAFVNPALLNKEMHNGLSFNHNFHLGSVNHSYFGYGRYMDKWNATVHAGIQYVGYGEFQAYDEFEQSQGTFKANELAFTVGASKQLYERLRVGMNIKAISSRMESYNSFGLSADIGAHYHIEKSQLSFALLFRNAGFQISTYVEDNREPLPFEIQAGISKRLKHLPFRFSVIATNLQRWNIRYDNPDDNANSEIIFGDTEAPEESTFSKDVDNFFRHLIFNGEFLFGKNETVRFRVGYNHLRKRELSVSGLRSLAGFSAGIGIKVKRFRIDYGYSAYHLAGGLNHISFSTNLKTFE